MVRGLFKKYEAQIKALEERVKTLEERLKPQEESNEKESQSPYNDALFNEWLTGEESKK